MGAGAFRERAPRLIVDENGGERLSIDDKGLGTQGGIRVIGGVGSRQDTGFSNGMIFTTGSTTHRVRPATDHSRRAGGLLYPSRNELATFDLEWWRRRRAPHREKPIASFGRR